MKYVVKFFISMTNLIWAFYFENFAKQSPGSPGKQNVEDLFSKVIVQICKYICGVERKSKNLLEIRLWHFSRYATGVSR